MRYSLMTAALVAAGAVTPALAAPPDAAGNAALLEKMMARLEKLEARNNELEKEVKALKGDNEKIAQGLENERLSQYEPELTARLKAAEKDVLEAKKSVKTLSGLEGLKGTAALATVGQTARGLPKGSENGGSQLNYRADVTVEMPLKKIGDTEHKLFAHFRMGQGLGLNQAFSSLGHFASAPNAVAFRASGANPDDSVAILGQAYYQAAIPLPFGGFKPYSRETMELTFGKMDIFSFFDQNTAAGDESKQFLNSVFVHNPLLDASREVGVDANGFQPGFIATYVNKTDKTQPWRLSMGVFGSGDKGANYQRSLSSPLIMAQAETQLKLFSGLNGNYRAYVWNRSKANELDGSVAKHTGFGASIDQRLGDGVNAFVRYGKLLKGKLSFDQALSVGGEISGSYWGRAADALGFAGSWLHASRDYKEFGGSGDLVGDGSGTFSYLPAGAEKVAEIYYRFRVSPQFDLTPDFQWISRPGANPEASSVKLFGLRANVFY